MAAAAASASPDRPFGRALLPLLALALATAIGFTVIGSFSIVQEGAKADLRLSDYSLSLIQGVGIAIPLALLSVPIGWLVDRFHRVRLLIALGAVWTAGTVLTALATSGAMLLGARMLTGIGTTGALTAALSLGADFCALPHRGRAILIINVGKMIGAASAFALTGVLFGFLATQVAQGAFGAIAPWRGTHFALAAISAVLILPLFLLREPARREVSAGTDARWPVLLGECWQRRAFLLPLFVGQACVVMADTAALIWAAPVLTRNYGLKPEQFAGWMGLVIFGTGFAGSVLGGFVADWGHQTGRRGWILIGALAAAVVGAPAALFAIAGSITLFAILLGIFVLCGTIVGLITSVALTVLIPNELRGLCIGALIAVAGLIGYGLAPTLVVWVSGLLGGEQHLDQGLAIVGAGIGTLSIGAFALAIRHAPASLHEAAF